jgi:hypothetical protein
MRNRIWRNFSIHNIYNYIFFNRYIYNLMRKSSEITIMRVNTDLDLMPYTIIHRK